MGVLQSIAFDEICQRGAIRDSDVTKLRGLFYADGEISALEAKGLFEINDACRVQDPSWADFFVEAISDYVVRDAEPYGYITTANADWVIDSVTRDGRLHTRTELELLLNILDKARWSPPRLVKFVLAQVKKAVIEGTGPMRDGTQLHPGVITPDDVRVLRRALYAFAGDGNIAITRAEAEVLFEINDAIDDAATCPEWVDLFVKAIANAVMGSSGYAVPSRHAALAQETWLESRGDLTLPSIASKALSGGLSGIIAACRSQSSEERAIAKLERQRIEIITNEAVTENEAGWLIERLMHDVEINEAERALLQFLVDECPDVHPRLQDLAAHHVNVA